MARMPSTGTDESEMLCTVFCTARPVVFFFVLVVVVVVVVVVVAAAVVTLVLVVVSLGSFA